MSRMIRWITIFCIACILPTKLSVADNSIPNITVMQKGADALIEDLNFLVNKLTNEEEQKQWVVLNDLLTSFKVGLDSKKPIRIDVLYGKGAEQYISYFPVDVKDLKDFRKNNLQANGITTAPIGRGFYKVKGSFIGFMRYIPDMQSLQN